MSQELIASDLLEERSQIRNGFQADFYLEREDVDGWLWQNLRSRQHIVLYGKPLAGKSRAIFQGLKTQFPESVVYLAPRSQSLILSEEEVTAILQSSRQQHKLCFFVFNDIDNFIDIEDFENRFKRLLEPENHVLVASCRTEFLESVRQSLMSFWEFVEERSIPPLTQEQRQILTQQGSEKEEEDDTIGSYFVPLKAMRSHYQTFERGRITGETRKEWEVLRSYKCIELWKRKNRGSKQAICEYAQKRLNAYYNDTNQVSLFEWEQVIKHLIDFGFVSDRGEKIYIEPAYLNRIISISETERIFAFEVVEYYPNIENFNKLIARVSNYELIQELYKNLLRNNCQPNEITYNTLMKQIKAPDQVRIFCKLIENSKMKPNIEAFSSLMYKIKDFDNSLDEGLYIDKIMVKLDFSHTTETLRPLIKEFPDFNEAWAFYKYLKAKNRISKIQPTIFNLTIKKADCYDQALQVFQYMQGLLKKSKKIDG